MFIQTQSFAVRNVETTISLLKVYKNILVLVPNVGCFGISRHTM